MTNAIWHLNDWLTSPSVPFFTKTTDNQDDAMHDHTFFEIFYMIEGSIGHIINGKCETLSKGEIYFLKPSDTHCFLRDANNRSRHRDVIIRAVLFRQLCDFIDPNLYNDFMSGKLRYKFLLSEKELEIFEERLGKMSQFLATERKNENLIMAHAKAVCLQLLTLQVDSRENAQTVQSEWFSSLLNRFNDAECLVSGLEYVLKPFFYSHEHICRVFKDRTGMTLTDYLNLKRLDHAADQLAYTKKSILEISMECGVSSLSYFNKIFKQRYGITPSRFRKRLFTAPELPVWSEITTNTQ